MNPLNPFRQIGRYEIPIASIVCCEKLQDGNWSVCLIGGMKVTLTADEKSILDTEREQHSNTMQVLHMVAHLQNANRPH